MTLKLRKSLAVILVLASFSGCGSVKEPAFTTVPSTTAEFVPAETTVPNETVAETTVPETTVAVTQYTEPLNSDFVIASEYVPNLLEDLRYATTDNFTGTKIYDFDVCYLRYGTALKLADAASEVEKLGYGILIWDGFRPPYAQEELWNICPDPTYVSKPGTGSQSHCRGIAVDITLYCLRDGQILEMPSGFDDFSKKADRDYSDCTPAAAENASTLEEIMILCGFKPYSGEGWHYSDTDSYPIENEFDPADIA